MANSNPDAAFAGVLWREGSMIDAEIENLLSKCGKVVAGASEAGGEGRAVHAAKAAIAPLLVDDSIKQASGILVEMVSGDSLTDSEISAVAEAIRQVGGPDTEMLICDLCDKKMAAAVRVTVVATGFDF